MGGSTWNPSEKLKRAPHSSNVAGSLFIREPQAMHTLFIQAEELLHSLLSAMTRVNEAVPEVNEVPFVYIKQPMCHLP